jgi:polyhydroxyalkanoate synthesis repressor PhaR
MRIIKKYTNRKLYDTIDKKYISLDRVAELVMDGEEVQILDTRTGEDLTTATISQLLAREKGVPSGVLIQLLQKGRGTIAHASRQYVNLWHNALTMAEGEMDRFISRMVKNHEISESEGKTFKRDYLGFVGNFRSWVGEKVDQQMADVLARVNLGAKEQADTLRSRVDALERRVLDLEQRAGILAQSPAPRGARGRGAGR